MKTKTCGECRIARPSGRQGWMYCPRKRDTVLSEAEQCETPYMTIGDKIRQMSDEELAKFLRAGTRCPPGECRSDRCELCWLQYIKEEAKDE